MSATTTIQATPTQLSRAELLKQLDRFDQDLSEHEDRCRLHGERLQRYSQALERQSAERKAAQQTGAGEPSNAEKFCRGIQLPGRRSA